MNRQQNEAAGPIDEAASGGDNTETTALDSESATVFESLLSHYRIGYDSMPKLPNTTELVRYLVGALATQAATECEHALLAEASLRRQLRQTLQSLRQLQRLSWYEVARRAHDPMDEYSAVACAWLEIVGERLIAAPQSPRRWQARGWLRIRQEVASGIREAQAAWSSFLAFGDQWRAVMRLHALTPSLQRGGAEEKINFAAGAGVAITDVECSIDQDGTLHVIALAVPLSQEASPQDSQSTVLLSLRRDDDLWPLATSTRVENRLEWALPGFGPALGLTEGSLRSQFFAFEVAEASYAARTSTRIMRAQVLDTAGEPIVSALAYIELVSDPRIENGQFSVEIGIPTFIRLAYPAYSLELCLFITEQYRQRLATWPLSDWEETPRLLTAPCPGVPDTVLPGDTLLQARLLVPE